MECYITRTSSFLPGPPVGNEDIERHLGSLEGESEVKESVLSMNGIVSRHYAQDESQVATHDVYDLGRHAAERCLDNSSSAEISYLSAGTTYSPLAAPGVASIIHDRLQEAKVINRPVEISSHSGVCTSASAALVAGIRAVSSDHDAGLVVGVEHASEVLKSSRIRPVDDRKLHERLRNSKWFMSVFLRFMLSDGAGACLLSRRPARDSISLRVNWTHSSSYAHEAPLCMKLDNASGLLSQDVSILAKYLVPTADKARERAFAANGDSLNNYRVVLPHMSSFFFRRKMERIIANGCDNTPTPYWTNLATAGNTGAASIFVMLDHYLRQETLTKGDRLLLFVPESGQFNFVFISLTVVKP